MQIGDKVKLREDGPVYGITDISEYRCEVKVDNTWYDIFNFKRIFKIIEE